MDVFVLKPAEAPPGIQRLLPSLQKSLTDIRYNKCRIIVAFARLSGVIRLLPQIRAWRSQGNSIEAIVGIDLFGTSQEALQIMLDELNAVYITRTSNQSCTFHPKMYLFEGPQRARGTVGSHNLTSGGLETNFEGGVVMDFDLPAEAVLWNPFVDAWNQLLPGVNLCTLKLDTALLKKLIEAGQLLPEARVASIARESAARETASSATGSGIFPAIAPAPPSPIPKELLKGLRPASPAKKKAAKPIVVAQPSTMADLPRALIMEIIPHHNGEILLSKMAADTFPAFFGMPFMGRTAPKKVAKNLGYPMRVPDPYVEFRLYDKNGKLTHRSQFGLNTVLYEKKSEIRITVTQSVARTIPKYSIMVMWGGSFPLPAGLDYVIDVFTPGSPGWTEWEPTMNITLPGGGKERHRRMGWI